MTIGEKINQVRKSKGMSLQQVAENMGVSYQVISQWERGLRVPKTSSLKRIAAAMGVDENTFTSTFIDGSYFAQGVINESLLRERVKYHLSAEKVYASKGQYQQAAENAGAAKELAYLLQLFTREEID